jgi:hypothetical protein
MIVKSTLLAVVVFLGSLTAAIPAARAQAQVHFVSQGRILTSILPERNLGLASIYPPEVVSDHGLWWIAAIHHWDSAGTYGGYTWTNWLSYTPPDVYFTHPGGWTDSSSGQGRFTALTYSLGTVQIQSWVWDTQQFIVNGQFGPTCVVFSSDCRW